MKATNWRLGMSSCGRRLDEKTFECYAENGVCSMEVSPSLAQLENLDYENTRKLAEKYAVELWSFHLPFCPFEILNLASFDKKLVSDSTEYFSELIKKSGNIGIKNAVIHPSGEPNGDGQRDELLKISADALAKLGEVAYSQGMTLAVEDLPRTCLGNCSSDIKRLIADNDKLRVAFDTNHLLDEKNEDFIKEVGDKIVTLHVSDYDFRNERHWLPYEGKNNWVDIVSRLEDVGYSGPFMYEISPKTPKSIIRGRDLEFSDFVENYKACIRKKPFEAFGVPDEAVCIDNSYYIDPVIKY
jgi:sugar phosphate isomerase/epimerase